MRTILSTITFLIFVSFLSAQQQTLFSDIDLIGGFGGPLIEISQMNGETVTDVGGGGGIILNNFFLGGYGQGTDAPNITILEQEYDLDFSHGGIWLGYVYPSHKLLHLYSSAKIGWGETTLKDGEGDKVASDNILALSPEIGIELNVTGWFRVAFTGGYRFVSGIEDLPGGLTNDSFSSAFGGITFRFGGFGYYEDDSDTENTFEFLEK